MTRAALASDAVLKELRAFGLAYPGAHTKSPWPDHLDLAVNDKTFAYLSLEGQPFGISCKLPHSCTTALNLPFCEPAGYGLGKSGWVSASFAHNDLPPLALFKEWLDESYRAQAPKKLVAGLAQRGAPAKVVATKAASKKAASKKAASKKAASKKAASKKAAPKKKASASPTRARKPSTPVKRPRKATAAKRAKR